MAAKHEDKSQLALVMAVQMDKNSLVPTSITDYLQQPQPQQQTSRERKKPTMALCRCSSCLLFYAFSAVLYDLLSNKSSFIVKTAAL